MKEVEIYEAAEKDLIQIAACHIAAFPDSLISKMGISYLTRVYEWYLRDDRAFLFYCSNESLLGFCGGIFYKDEVVMGSASSMTQFSFYQAIKAILKKPWLIIHKEMIAKYGFIIKNFWYRIFPPQNTPGNEKGEFVPFSGLVVIAVDPDQQGKGIGQKLLSEFESRSVRLGLHLMRLSVEAKNGRAIAAYKKSGWEIFSNDGKSVGMQKRIA